MGADAIQPVLNLGVAGFAILVMWWMYQHSSNQLERKDEAFRALEKEIRENILTQLGKNTAAFERVLDHFSKHS